VCDFAAWKLSSKKHGFKDAACLLRNLTEADLLLYPQQDTRAQPVWFDQPNPPRTRQGRSEPRKHESIDSVS